MSQTPLSSFGFVKDREQQVRPGFEADGRRRDCCFKGCGTTNETCFIGRCHPNGEAAPQCATCQPANCYVNRFIGFRTAAEIMQEGGH